MLAFMSITKALADENRIRILMALRDRELCVCQIIELLGLAPSTVSKHLFILKQARLIRARKDGRWMHYRQAGKRAPAEIRGALRWIHRSLADRSQVLADKRRLDEILQEAPRVMCR
jgi:DNA-binding transcriptional ArsR family regulator